MTFPERLLWSRLRRGALGVEVRRQAPVGPYVVDFLVPAERLVVEVDGRSHDGQGEADRERERALGEMGLRVVRVSNDDVIHDVDAVVAAVRAAIGAG
jgi:very-short-patch-repair endonuclease